VTNLKALSQASPPHDYQPALQGALSWLGKRYLLAEPLNRRNPDRQDFPSEPKRPLPVLRIVTG
jgi:hypothetical protein